MAKVNAFDPELREALCGLGLDLGMVDRVVIEIQHGEAVRIYVSSYVDQRVARVVSALRHGEVEIVHTGEQPEEGDGRGQA